MNQPCSRGRTPPQRHPPAWLLCALLGACGAASAVELQQYEGEARDPDSGALLYRETHLVRQREGEPEARLVLYRCADGTAFARKQVDYRSSRTAPEFTLEDVRTGYREGLRREDDTRLWFQPSRREPERDAVASAPALVADAGFDEFIRRQWTSLANGTAVRLDFAVPARLDSYAFELRKVGEHTVHGQPALRLRLKLGGWLRWLAPAIDVSYALSDRRLLRFEGISNLRNDAGNAQIKARIDFPNAPRAASEAQWQRTRQLQLRACQPTRALPVMQPRPA